MIACRLPRLRQYLTRVLVSVVLSWFFGAVCTYAEESCEAPATFMGIGWYYCEDPEEQIYYAAPSELLHSTNLWGATIWCDYPPTWKFWKDPEVGITFIITDTTVNVGDISLTVQSTAYDAHADLFEADAQSPRPLHRTIITDPDSVTRILDSLADTDAIRWEYSDPPRAYTLGTITLPLVLPAVLQKCGVVW